jgi:hypothetical protein
MISLTSTGLALLAIALAAAICGFLLRFRTSKDAGQSVKLGGGYSFFGVALFFLFIMLTYGVRW